MGQVCCQNTRVEIPADVYKNNNQERDTNSIANYYQEDKNKVEQNQYEHEHDTISRNNQQEHTHQFKNDYNSQQIQIEADPAPEIKSLEAHLRKYALTPFSYVADQRGEDSKTIYIEQKGGWYKGQVVGQTPHGNGCFYFNDNQAHGEGIFEVENYQYRGNWKHNKPDGQGFEKFQNEKYKGSFLQGCKHGKGVYHFSNGCIYQGDFYWNVIQGYGTLTYPDKRKHYTGQWKTGQMHGYGKFQWLNGSRYEETFIKNLFEKRKILLQDRRHILGQMEKEKEKYITKNGENIITEWQNGILVE